MEFYFKDIDLPTQAAQNEIHATLATLRIGGADPAAMRGYLDSDFLRFLYTLALTPDERARTLEVGSNPYFMTALLRMYRPGLALDCVNYFEAEPPTFSQDVTWTTGRQDHAEIFASYNVNLEAARLPVPDGSYGVVLFCEVLEHFTADPLAAVRELSRVLEPGGRMILTTPNVCRFGNLVSLLEGSNLYDPYSAYGPHGRHNREYTRHELHLLMTHAGFECEIAFTSDVHPHGQAQLPVEKIMQFIALTPNREHDLGQYLFTRWRKISEPAPGLPAWLYRSYPAESLV